MYIDGQLRTRKWTDQTGQNATRLKWWCIPAVPCRCWAPGRIVHRVAGDSLNNHNRADSFQVIRHLRAIPPCPAVSATMTTVSRSNVRPPQSPASCIFIQKFNHATQSQRAVYTPQRVALPVTSLLQNPDFFGPAIMAMMILPLFLPLLTPLSIHGHALYRRHLQQPPLALSHENARHAEV